MLAIKEKAKTVFILVKLWEILDIPVSGFAPVGDRLDERLQLCHHPVSSERNFPGLDAAPKYHRNKAFLLNVLFLLHLRPHSHGDDLPGQDNKRSLGWISGNNFLPIFHKYLIFNFWIVWYWNTKRRIDNFIYICELHVNFTIIASTHRRV